MARAAGKTVRVGVLMLKLGRALAAQGRNVDMLASFNMAEQRLDASQDLAALSHSALGSTDALRMNLDNTMGDDRMGDDRLGASLDLAPVSRSTFHSRKTLLSSPGDEMSEQRPRAPRDVAPRSHSSLGSTESLLMSPSSVLGEERMGASQRDALPSDSALGPDIGEQRPGASPDLAPVSHSTLGSTESLGMSPSKELLAAAPLTFQTLQQMHTSGLLPDIIAAPAASVSVPTAQRLAEDAPRPKASLVAAEESVEKPVRPRRRSSTPAPKEKGERVRRHAGRRSFASMPQTSSEGSSASLDEAGYQAVAALRDSRAMWFFIRRVVESNNAEVLDEGMFNGLVPYYSGERDVQSFDRLNEELFQSGREHGMIKKRFDHVQSRGTDLAELYERTHKL